MIRVIPSPNSGAYCASLQPQFRNTSSQSNSMDRKRSFLGSIKKAFSTDKDDKTSLSPRRSITSSTRSTTSNSVSSNPSPWTRRTSQVTTSTTSEAPPPYTPTESSASDIDPIPLRVPTLTRDDDPYAFLTSFDTVFLIDDSGSMAGRNWREVAAALEKIAPICTSHDADGIDIFFLNTPDNPYYHNVTSDGTVREIFQTVHPFNGTLTGQRINSILRPYIRKVEADPDGTKPMNLIIITDGESKDDIQSVLEHFAKRLDKVDAIPWQLGVQLFQIGHNKDVTEFFEKIDTSLKGQVERGELRDMVDTVLWKGDEGTELNGEGILKAVMGAIDKRQDRKSNKGLHKRR